MIDKVFRLLTDDTIAMFTLYSKTYFVVFYFASSQIYLILFRFFVKVLEPGEHCLFNFDGKQPLIFFFDEVMSDGVKFML